MTRFVLFPMLLVGVSALVFVQFARVDEWLLAALTALMAVGVGWEWIKGTERGGEPSRAAERLVLWFSMATLGTSAALGL